MRRANGGSRYAMPFSIKPDLGQFSENSVQSASKQRCHVFQHNASRSQFANHANDFKEQAAPLTLKSCAFPGVGNVLTRKASGDDFDGLRVGLWPSSHVWPTSDVWPVFGKDSVCIFINLHLPLADQSGSLETKVKSRRCPRRVTQRSTFAASSHSFDVQNLLVVFPMA
jgi:hypothetical protein